MSLQVKINGKLSSDLLCFSDSEKFDNFYETRIDELIKEAEELEQTLIKQKGLLKEKLKGLTKTLAMAAESW